MLHIWRRCHYVKIFTSNFACEQNISLTCARKKNKHDLDKVIYFFSDNRLGFPKTMYLTERQLTVIFKRKRVKTKQGYKLFKTAKYRFCYALLRSFISHVITVLHVSFPTKS